MRNSNSLLRKIFKSNERLKNDKYFMFESSSTNIFLNNFSYLRLKEEKIDFNNFNNIFCDGAFFAKLAGNKIRKKISRISFDETSLAFKWINNAIRERMKILIIGATQDENNKFIEQLKQRFEIDESNIDGMEGYSFNADNINFDKDFSYLVIIGLGTPQQENLAISL